MPKRKYATTSYIKKIGTKTEVWKGIARETSGKLQKKDLMISKRGTVVSKKASLAASKRMKSSKGICGYCIRLYKKGEIKYVETKSEKKQRNIPVSERKLKEKKIKGISQKRVDELEKEIKKLREKAHELTIKHNKITPAVEKLLKKKDIKVMEMIKMKVELRKRKKQKKKNRKKRN